MPLRGRSTVLVVVALALMGCGGDDNESSSETQNPTEQQTPAPAAESETSPLVIEVQRGVGGASLGMSEDQVRDALGEPLRSDQVRNATGPYTELTYPDGFTVALQRGGEFEGGASSFFVKGTSARTSGGVGVGSSEEDVKSGVDNVTCEDLGGRRVCHVGDYEPQQTITEFEIAAGRVKHVRVATVGN